jgi:hypothetical protein
VEGGRIEDAKRPAEWLRSTQAQGFVEFIADSLGVGISHIIKTTKGKSAATWAHWQIAMAYAKQAKNKHLEADVHCRFD